MASTVDAEHCHERLERAAATLEARRLELVEKRDRLDAHAATLAKRAERSMRIEAELEERERVLEDRRAELVARYRELDETSLHLTALVGALGAFVGQSSTMAELASARVGSLVERHRCADT